VFTYGKQQMSIQKLASERGSFYRKNSTIHFCNAKM